SEPFRTTLSTLQELQAENARQHDRKESVKKLGGSFRSDKAPVLLFEPPVLDGPAGDLPKPGQIKPISPAPKRPGPSTRPRFPIDLLPGPAQKGIHLASANPSQFPITGSKIGGGRRPI